MRIGLIGLIALLVAAAYYLNPSEAQFRDYQEAQLKTKGVITQLATPLMCSDARVKNNYVYSTFERRCMGAVTETCTGAFGRFYCKDSKDDDTSKN